jgi:hypothetical protein
MRDGFAPRATQGCASELAWPNSGTPSKGRPAATVSSPSREAREGEGAQRLRGCLPSQTSLQPVWSAGRKDFPELTTST